MFNLIILCIVLVTQIDYRDGCFIILEPPTSSTSFPTTTTAPKIVMDSVILTSGEKENLHNITGYTGKLTLLWRGTRDGFSASAFHLKCDGKANTITLIKSTLNYVFGGYTSRTWDSSNRWVNDTSAFIFSLRTNGISILYKYLVVDSRYAILNLVSNGPTFGYDIYVSDNYELNQVGTTKCYDYECPNGINRYSKHSELAGNSSFQISEIEVFQMP